MQKKQIEFKEKSKNTNLLLEVDILQNELQVLASKKGSVDWINRRTQEFSMENHLGLLRTDIQRKITERILEKLDSLKNTRILDKPSEKEEKIAKFEFLLNSEQENLKKMIKYQELDKKIQNLERFIGISQSQKVQF